MYKRQTVDDIAKAIALDPKNKYHWFCTDYVTSSIAHLKLHEPQKALDDANNAVKYRPKSDAAVGTGQVDLYGLYAYKTRATANLELKNYSDALRDAQSALSIDPNSYEILGVKANALCGLQKYDEALSAIDEAIKISPETESLKSDRDLISKYKLQNSKQSSSR